MERGAEVVEVLASYVRTNDDGSRKVFAKVKYDDNTTEVLPTVILMRQCPTVGNAVWLHPNTGCSISSS